MSPDYAVVWYMKGLDLDRLGRYAEAAESYDKALNLDSQYAKVWYKKGLTLQKLKITKVQ